MDAVPEGSTTMIDTEHLSYEVIGTTAVVTMNRPEAKNSLSGPMLVGMVDAWAEIDRNDDIRCAILTGAGGTEILQGTDIRVAGESATFGLFEAKRGLYPLGGSVVRLVRQIPYTVAMDLLLTARAMGAPEAKAVGLIGHVVPDGTALDKAHEIAEVIGANGPLAVEAIKTSLRVTDGMSEAEALAEDLKIGWPIFSSEDAAEGMKAFTEKRPPVYRRK